MAATWRTKADYVGECETCGKTFMEQNAMALAGKHFKATGHKIRVEMSRAYYFDPDGHPSLIVRPRP